MNAETIAALERAARSIDHLIRPTDQEQADAATIRALIERERNGGERAQVVAWLNDRTGRWPRSTSHATSLADAIASGAHLNGEAS